MENLLKDQFFTEPELVSGSPPTSNCNYESLDICPIIPHRIYDSVNFRKKSILNKLDRNLKVLEPDNEIRMLVLCMYESYSDEDNFDPLLLRTLLIIVHLIAYRDKMPVFTITIEDKERILKYCSDIQFNFINWNRFYGVYDKFYFHLPRNNTIV